jgi:hypothetical protein
MAMMNTRSVSPGHAIKTKQSASCTESLGPRSKLAKQLHEGKGWLSVLLTAVFLVSKAEAGI